MTEEDMLFYERVTSSLRGELSPNEQQELDQLIESDPEKRKECEKMLVTYDLLSLCAATEAEPREIPVEVLEGFRSYAKKYIKPKQPNGKSWLFLALWLCGITIAVIGGLFLRESLRKKDVRLTIEYAVQLNNTSIFGSGPPAPLVDKLNKIIFPTITLQNASLEEVIEYLRVKSRELDTFTPESEDKGVAIILRQGNLPNNVSLSLDLKDIPLSEAIRYVAELSKMSYKIESFAVIMTPLAVDSSEQHTQSFRAPPDLFVSASETPKSILERGGITFPEGSSAFYNPNTTMLVIRNTQPNIDLTEALLESVSYPLDAVVLRDILDGSEVHEIDNEADLQRWENKWSSDEGSPVFKMLLQERGTWIQPWSKFNKYDIGRIKVMGHWRGQSFLKTFRVTSVDPWAKAAKEAQTYITETVEQGK